MHNSILLLDNNCKKGVKLLYKDLLERKRRGERFDFAFVGDDSLLELYLGDDCTVETIAELFSVPVYEVSARLIQKGKRT